MVEIFTVIRIFQLLLALFVVQQGWIFLWRGHWRTEKKNYYITSPFPFIPYMPPFLHNLTILLTFFAGILLLVGGDAAIFGAFLAAACIGYHTLFGYSVWHHGHYHFVLMLLLSGLFFAIPFPVATNPFLILIAWQLAVPYFFSGFFKIHPALLNSTLLYDSMYPKYKAMIPKTPFITGMITWTTIVSEMLLGILILIPIVEIQKVAIVLGVLFHLGVYIITRKGNVFHFATPAMYLLVMLPFLPAYQNDFGFFLFLIVLPAIVVLGAQWAYQLKATFGHKLNKPTSY